MNNCIKIDLHDNMVQFGIITQVAAKFYDIFCSARKNNNNESTDNLIIVYLIMHSILKMLSILKTDSIL